MLQLDHLLSVELLGNATRVGSEWLIPFPEVLQAVSIATFNEIAILGVEAFRVQSDGFQVLDYSGYEFAPDGNWQRFVAQNNHAAQQYIIGNPSGEGCGYILTSTSSQQFDELSVRL